MAALKGAPKGPVNIAVAKPISVLESPSQVSYLNYDLEKECVTTGGNPAPTETGHNSNLLSVSSGASSLLKSESF